MCIPRGLDEIIDLYGDPRDENGEMSEKWARDNLDLYKLPFRMRTWAGQTTERFRAHKIVGPVFESILFEFVTLCGVGYLKDTGYDFWGGCWWYRPMRGYDALSTHSWGIAFDYAPNRAPQGAGPETQNQVLVRLCEEEGLRWGGRWSAPYRCDPHHFQAARGY